MINTIVQGIEYTSEQLEQIKRASSAYIDAIECYDRMQKTGELRPECRKHINDCLKMIKTVPREFLTAERGEELDYYVRRLNQRLDE